VFVTQQSKGGRLRWKLVAWQNTKLRQSAERVTGRAIVGLAGVITALSSFAKQAVDQFAGTHCGRSAVQSFGKKLDGLI